MTKIVKLNEQSVTPVEAENPYTDYGKAAAKKPRLILGDIMRFVKGEYLVGKKDVLPDDTEAAAAMQVFYVGWTKWIDGKPVAQIMVRVGSGQKPPKRKTLGDMDPGQWPTNKRGEPENPWRWTVYLPLITRAGAVYTFASNTNGGRTATGELCEQYGARLKDHPNRLPVVRLGLGGYEHPQGYGWIDEPDFVIVDYAPKADCDKVLKDMGVAIVAVTSAMTTATKHRQSTLGPRREIAILTRTYHFDER
jgi:hypothetical protein